MKKKNKKASESLKGKKFTKKHKEKLSNSHWAKKFKWQDEFEKFKKNHCFSKNNTPWNVGLTKETDERLKNSKCSQPHSKEWNKKVSIALKDSKIRQEYYKSKKFRQTCVKGAINARKKAQISPNQVESKFQQLCKKYKLPYKFVGDGEFWLGNPPKNPDFLNTNGKKEVIEIHGVYWHLIKPKKQNPKLTRKVVENIDEKHFLKYGFDCKIIWEDEFDKENWEQNILNKLR